MSTGRAVFLGSKAFGLAIFQALIEADPSLSWQVCHPEDCTDGRSVLPAFDRFCSERAIPFSIVARASDAHAAIEAATPDIVFVCGWYVLIPEAVLASGPRFFGIHNSLLPKYRGGAPLVWAMICGEQRVGSTLFGITPGMDDGPVFLQVSAEPTEDDGIDTVIAELEAKFLVALQTAWPAIVQGTRQGSPQDDRAATYCGQRRPEDGRIDWSRSAAAVHDFVRAQTRPYPGAFTVIRGGETRIWRTRPVAAVYCGTPGQILERRADQVLISCGYHSALAVLEASGPRGETALTEIFPSLSLRLGGSAAPEESNV